MKSASTISMICDTYSVVVLGSVTVFQKTAVLKELIINTDFV